MALGFWLVPRDPTALTFLHSRRSECKPCARNTNRLGRNVSLLLEFLANPDGDHDGYCVAVRIAVMEYLAGEYVYRENLSRKGAKAQSAAAFLRISLRLCARNISFLGYRGVTAPMRFDQ